MFTRGFFNVPAWEPLNLRNMFEDMLKTGFQRFPDIGVAGVFPLLNVTEDKDHYYVRAELPGIKAEDIEISATGTSLAISGERKIAAEDKDAKYHRREREAGKFSRIINLPTTIDSDKIEAKLTDGILTIILPKAESAKPRQIVIK